MLGRAQGTAGLLRDLFPFLAKLEEAAEALRMARLLGSLQAGSAGASPSRNTKE
jgi:hypothetical protein